MSILIDETRSYSVKKATCMLAVIAFVGLLCPLRAEITTVYLPKETSTTFTVASQRSPTTLTFDTTPAFPSGPIVSCTLRVVATPQPNPPRENQDVIVKWKTKQVALWSAYNNTNKPFLVKLRPESCAPGNNIFTLETNSKSASWDYYGGAETSTARRPRLVVTYDVPTPPHTGDSTDWKYYKPDSFFSSRLWSAPRGQTLIMNPVFYHGATYLIAKGGTGIIYRAPGAHNAQSWQLPGLPLSDKSSAFVTTAGRAQIISENAVYSCDLQKLASLGEKDGKSACATTGPNEKITVNAGTPAMGPDGSLYFKNVQAGGSVVALNPALQEIWKSDLKITSASPIALSENGRYAYLLGEISVDKATKIALLRMNTASGETDVDEITYKNDQKVDVKPLLRSLLKPAVVSKRINGSSVDYVFVGGNTNESGVLQLIAFEQAGAHLVWSQLGKLAAAPAASLDGNSVFAAWEDSRISRYPWYNTADGKQGAFTMGDLKPVELGKVPHVSRLLLDGGGSMYIAATPSLWVYEASSGKLSDTHVIRGLRNLQFTDDGKLIGYTPDGLFDLSPKIATAITQFTLANETIYSANTVTVPASLSLPKANHVIFKGSSVTIGKGLRVSPGATLSVQSVAPSGQ
jgi:hypothetical protein